MKPTLSVKEEALLRVQKAQQSPRRCGGPRVQINEYMRQHPECRRGKPGSCPELDAMFRAWKQQLDARVAAATGTMGGAMAQYGYGYLDMGEGLGLIQVHPGQKVGYSFYDGKDISLKGRKLLPVPRRWLQIHRAPTVIFKPDASPDVTNAVDIEMVDLAGAGSAPSPLRTYGGLAAAALALAGGVFLVLRT